MLLLAVMCPAELYAQIEWRSMNGPRSSRVVDVEVAGNGDIYILNSSWGNDVDQTGLYKSSDGGATWHLLLHEESDVWDLMLLDGSVVLFMDGINYTCRQDGAEWERSFDPAVQAARINYYPEIRDTCNWRGSVFSASEYDAVRQSTDEGKTWTPLPLLPYSRTRILDLECDTSGRLLAATSNGLYRYNGSAWERLFGRQGLFEEVRNILPLYDGMLLVTSNSGYSICDPNDKSWKEHHFTIEPNYYGYWDSYAYRQYRFVRVDSLVFRSTDFGRTWESLSLPNTRDLPILKAIDSTGSLYLSFSRNRSTIFCMGTYRSDDFGETWTEVAGPDCFSMATVDRQNRIVEFHTMNVSCSCDKGENWSTWHRIFDDQPSFVAPDGRLFFVDWQAIRVTTDCGATWEDLNFPSATLTRHLAWDDDGTMYISMSGRAGGILVSFDDAKSWSVINNGLAYPSCSGLHISDDGYGYAKTPNGLYRSTRPLKDCVDYYREK